MAKLTKQQLRLTQLKKFLGEVDACGAKFSQRQKKEIGKLFLEDVMGFAKSEFVACKQGKETPDFEPRNEALYPWALFITDEEDLREEFDNRALQYLHGDNVAEEFYAVIINSRELCVFGSEEDEVNEIAKYTVDFDELLDGNKKTSKNWQAFLNNFGVESAEKKKKERRKKGIVDITDRKSKFKKLISGVKPKCNEQTLIKDFVLPFCQLAGWKAHSLDEGDELTKIEVEKQVRKGRPDILLTDDGIPRIVIECKAPKVTLYNGEITKNGEKAMEQVHEYARGLRYLRKSREKKKMQLPNIMSMVINGKQVIWFDSSGDLDHAFRTVEAQRISDEVLNEIWSIINVKEVRASDLKQVCKHSTNFDERKAIQESSTHLLSKRVLEWLKKILNDNHVDKEDALAMTLQVLFLTIARDDGILGEEEIDKNLGNWDRLFKRCKKRFNSNVFEIQRPPEIEEITLDTIYEDSKKLGYRVDVIPVKYVGNIYEDLLQYLHKDDPNSSNTSYYTPDWLVEEIIKQLNPDTNDKIIDPTCGSAAFLTYAFDYITKDKSFEESKKYLKNIFGIDCDPLAVQVSRFALLVSLARKVDGELVGKEHILPMLTKNIMCKDFLEFETKTRFDIALGNPPWGSIDKEVRNKKIKSSLKGFKSYANNTDICVYIVEKAFGHLSSKGKMGFLVQRQTLDGPKHEKFRDWWCGRVEEVWDYKSDDLFNNGALTAVLLGKSTNAKRPYNIINRSKEQNIAHKLEVNGRTFDHLFWCSQGAKTGCDEVYREYAKEYPEDTWSKPLATKIYNGDINKEGKILFIAPQTSDCDVPPRIKQWLKNKKIFIKDAKKIAENFLKIRSETKPNKYLSWQRFNNYKHYKFDGSQMRIVIPRFLNGERLAAGLDLKGKFICITSITVLIPKVSTTRDEIFFTLAWLNSRQFVQTEATKASMLAKGGRRMVPEKIKIMIIPEIPPNIRSKIIALAKDRAKYGFDKDDLSKLDNLFENGLQRVKAA